VIIEKKKLSDLIPAPYNPRQSTEKQEKQLKASLEKFGVVEPIIFNKQTGYIVGGHFRVRELKKIGYKEVECVIVDLSPEDERELNIRLNANTGGWDWEELANNWEAQKLEEWGLDVPDFKVEPEAEEDDYEVPETITTDIVPGDLFEIGDHRLLCGDSTNADDVARLMNGQKADMVFTDPPYAIYGSSTGVGDDISDTKMIQPFFRQLFANMHLFLDGHFYICCDWRTYPLLNDLLNAAYFKVKNMIVWDKVNMGMGMFYRNQHELIITGYPRTDHIKLRGKKTYGNVQDGNVWSIKREYKKQHGAQKPVEAASRAIKNSSKENQLILEFFTGSGTTMVAGHELKRKCYGMELDPKYCQVIVDRMRKLDPALVIKRNGEVI
jgi:DNA modification methylase